jgi:sucrose phosphorylase
MSRRKEGWREQARGHLASLYGDRRATECLARLDRVISDHRGHLPGGRGAGLSEKDAILITYPDQVREPGIPPLQTLGAFCREYVSGLLTILHILPFYPSSSDDGFAVMDYRAVDPSLGTWDDIRGLRRDFRLMFDAVINHTSARAEWFARFLGRDPRYSSYFMAVEGDPDLSGVVRPRTSPLLTAFETAAGPLNVWTTFSADQPDLDYSDPQVLLEVVDILLGYVERGAEFLRLDAVGYLWKEIGTRCIHLPQTHRIVQLLRSVLDGVAPQVYLVTETNVAHAENISYFGDGGNEAQLVYNFALPPLVLHALLRESSRWLRDWARDLATPGNRTAFLNFLASHDGIGLNPARDLLPSEEIEFLIREVQERGGLVSFKSGPGGRPAAYELNINYLDALTAPGDEEPEGAGVRRFLAAHAILLALPGVPALYFHSVFGSRGWREGAAATGHNRAINREKLGRGRLQAELEDPRSSRFGITREMARLLRARSRSAAFAPSARHEILDCGDGVFGLIRRAEDDMALALCLHNLTGREQRVDLGLEATSRAFQGPWRDMLTGTPIDVTERPRVSLGPYAVRWIGLTAPMGRGEGMGPGKGEGSPP